MDAAGASGGGGAACSGGPWQRAGQQGAVRLVDGAAAGGRLTPQLIHVLAVLIVSRAGGAAAVEAAARHLQGKQAGGRLLGRWGQRRRRRRAEHNRQLRCSLAPAIALLRRSGRRLGPGAAWAGPAALDRALQELPPAGGHCRARGRVVASRGAGRGPPAGRTLEAAWARRCIVAAAASLLHATSWRGRDVSLQAARVRVAGPMRDLLRRELLPRGCSAGEPGPACALPPDMGHRQEVTKRAGGPAPSPQATVNLAPPPPRVPRSRRAPQSAPALRRLAILLTVHRVAALGGRKSSARRIK